MAFRSPPSLSALGCFHTSFPGLFLYRLILSWGYSLLLAPPSSLNCHFSRFTVLNLKLWPLTLSGCPLSHQVPWLPLRPFFPSLPEPWRPLPPSLQVQVGRLLPPPGPAPGASPRSFLDSSGPSRSSPGLLHAWTTLNSADFFLCVTISILFPCDSVLPAPVHYLAACL